jgi:preprotein translocase subunit YajC
MILANLRLMTQAAEGLSGWVLPLVGQVAAESDATTKSPASQGPLLDFLANPLNLILISAILFMFLVARPQNKKRQEQDQSQVELKKNDRVVTHSGIHGIVVQTQDGLVTIRIDENSGARMTVNRDSIASITPSDSKE